MFVESMSKSAVGYGRCGKQSQGKENGHGGVLGKTQGADRLAEVALWGPAPLSGDRCAHPPRALSWVVGVTPQGEGFAGVDGLQEVRERVAYLKSGKI